MKHALNGIPFGNRILVKVDEAETRTAGGIWIPDVAKKKGTKGVIVAVGYDEEKLEPLPFWPGQQVLFGEYSGTEIEFEDGMLLTMYARDVIYFWPVPEEWKEECINNGWVRQAGSKTKDVTFSVVMSLSNAPTQMG